MPTCSESYLTKTSLTRARWTGTHLGCGIYAE
jgi:hypothetical protein